MPPIPQCQRVFFSSGAATYIEGLVGPTHGYPAWFPTTFHVVQHDRYRMLGGERKITTLIKDIMAAGAV